MTTDDPSQSFTGQFQLLDGYTALQHLRADSACAAPLQIWSFLIDTTWFVELFDPHLQHSTIQLLVDHRQRANLRPLLQTYRHLHIATWATNRTMHDKTILFPTLALSYLTTANITRGAWTLSANSFLRIRSEALAIKLTNHFNLQWRAARPLLKSERP